MKIPKEACEVLKFLFLSFLAKTPSSFTGKSPINLLMILPMLLGYVVGAIGIYTLLYKLSPMMVEDQAIPTTAAGTTFQAEVIELFPREESDQRKVA